MVTGGRVEEEGHAVLDGAHGVVAHHGQQVGPAGHVGAPQLEHPGARPLEGGAEHQLVLQGAQGRGLSILYI